MIDAAEIERLAACDRAAWKRLGEVMRAEQCPPELVCALIAIDEPDGWALRPLRAFEGPPPEASQHVVRPFSRWLAAGIVRHLPPSDLRALRARARAIQHYAGDDATVRTSELVADLERQADPPLLARALIVLARRLDGDEDYGGALAAAGRAEDIFAVLDDTTSRVRAVRVRARALLRLGRIDEALALVDAVSDAEITPFESNGAYVYLSTARKPRDPDDAALGYAMWSVLWGRRDCETWISALGELAKRVGHPGCAARFEAGQRILDAERARRIAADVDDDVPGPMR